MYRETGLKRKKCNKIIYLPPLEIRNSTPPLLNPQTALFPLFSYPTSFESANSAVEKLPLRESLQHQR